MIFLQLDSHIDVARSILILDSLKMHNKNAYAILIYKWLNLEWKRLRKGKVENSTAPFSSKSMPLITPRSKY